MPEPTTGVLSPETRQRLATASATGRLLLATLARWLDAEARPAMAAFNADMRGLSDEEAEQVAKSIPAKDDPDELADAMVTVPDAIGRTEGLTSGDWRAVRRLAGEWLGRRPG